MGATQDHRISPIGRMAAHGEMAARVAAFDWAKTPLGPKSGWPLHLRTAVDICLNTRFPMRVWWGPGLINIYNDAYAIVLGDRHPQALGKSVQDLWSEVWSDASRLQQILWNLISNAIKFTPKGGRVQVLLERVNSHLEISVIDTGEGIHADFLPFIFDRFRQADASITRRHGRLGLGLSIVKQLVELHGGSIHVKSAGPGHGSTFIVALPVIVLHAQPAPETERRHPRVVAPTQRAIEPADQIHGVRVLVVDDEPDARELVKRLLEDCKAVVTATGAVDDAVNLIKTGEFDVLVSDIGMPGRRAR